MHTLRFLIHEAVNKILEVSKAQYMPKNAGKIAPKKDTKTVKIVRKPVIKVVCNSVCQTACKPACKVACKHTADKTAVKADKTRDKNTAFISHTDFPGPDDSHNSSGTPGWGLSPPSSKGPPPPYIELFRALNLMIKNADGDGNCGPRAVSGSRSKGSMVL